MSFVSNSQSSEKNQEGPYGPVTCQCSGKLAVRYISRTKDNPNRPYYKCKDAGQDDGCRMWVWEDRLPSTSYISGNKGNSLPTSELQTPRPLWTSKRPRDPSPSSPDCSPFRSSNTQPSQGIDAHSPKDKSKKLPSITLFEDELWNDVSGDKDKHKSSPSLSSRVQKIMEGLDEDDGPPRKRQRVDFSLVHTEEPFLITPKPSEHFQLTTSQEPDDPFLMTSTPAAQTFSIHGQNLSDTPKSMVHIVESQELLNDLEASRKKDEEKLTKLREHISKLERRHIADTQSIEYKLKMIKSLQTELKEQKEIVAALKAERGASITSSSSSHDSLMAARSTKFRNNGAYSQP